MRNAKASGTRFEHKFIDYLETKKYDVQRSAGSFYEDVWAIREDGKLHRVEVKSVNGKFYLSRCKEQLFLLLKHATDTNSIPVLAVAFKRKGWKFFLVNQELFDKKVLKNTDLGNYEF